MEKEEMSVPEEPRPCPFCKSTDVEIDVSRYSTSEFYDAFYRCWNCGSQGPLAQGVLKEAVEAQALRGWQRRASRYGPFVAGLFWVTLLCGIGFWAYLLGALIKGYLVP